MGRQFRLSSGLHWWLSFRFQCWFAGLLVSLQEGVDPIHLLSCESRLRLGKAFQPVLSRLGEVFDLIDEKLSLDNMLRDIRRDIVPVKPCRTGNGDHSFILSQSKTFLYAQKLPEQLGDLRF